MSDNTTERDELAKALFISDNHKVKDAAAEWELLLKNPKYRKPRQVTTVAELDALPDGAVVLAANGACREGLKSVGGHNFWRTFGPAKVLRSEELTLPAKVLWEPSDD